MNQGKYVFAQLVDFLPKAQFDYIVKKYGANKGIRSFTYWNQMSVMLFGQLSARESMRDTISAPSPRAGQQRPSDHIVRIQRKTRLQSLRGIRDNTHS